MASCWLTEEKHTLVSCKNTATLGVILMVRLNTVFQHTQRDTRHMHTDTHTMSGKPYNLLLAFRFWQVLRSVFAC